MPSSPVLAAEQRAWHYWSSDGIGHILIGLTNLLFALCMLYPPPRPTAWSVSIVLPLVAWVAAFGFYFVFALRYRAIAEWLKTKITYPRTGYVRSPFAECATQPELELLSLSETQTPRSDEGLRLDADRRKRAGRPGAGN